MPYRQVIFGTARIPIVSDAVIPFRARTVFSDYAINTGRPVEFAVPLDTTADGQARRDSLRAARDSGHKMADSLRPRDWADRWPGGALRAAPGER